MIKAVVRLLLILYMIPLLAACGGGGGGDGPVGSGSSGTSSSSSSGSSSGTSSGTTSSQRIAEVALSLGNTSVTADGSSVVSVRATVEDSSDAKLSGKLVTFTTTAGSFQGGVNTDTTDSDGIAEVFLVAPSNIGAAAISASSEGIWSAGGSTVELVAGLPTQVSLTASPNDITLGASTDIQVEVKDANNNPVEGESVSFTVTTNNSGGQLSLPSVTTDANGRATLSYTGGSSIGLDTIAALTSNNVPGTVNVNVDSANAVLGSLAFTEPNGTGQLDADGVSYTRLRATLLDTSASAVQGMAITFNTSAGHLNSAGSGVTSTSVSTDASGQADVLLYSTTTLNQANVSASVGGFNQTVDISFVAGSASATNSSITTSPSTVPADGVSESTVTVILVDSNGNILPDGSTVTLVTDNGTISTANPATTSSGRAEFTLVAPATQGTANLSIAELGGVTGGISFGSNSTAEAANVQLSVANPSLSVAGVGQTENTAINIQIVEANGSPIDETNWGTNNTARVSFVTRPNGGEYLSGVNAAGNVVTTQSSSSIDVLTVDGSLQVNLQSGTLPGVVEVRVEALDQTGNPYSTPVVASVPQVSIASGPAHTIVLSYPVTDAIEDLNQANPPMPGFYRRKAGAVVTDRYGNAVADGTAINLGLIDSVIAESSLGSTTQAQNQFADNNVELSDGTATDFLSAQITRNLTSRSIQVNDRVLALNAQAEDKSRFVSSTAMTAIDVQSSYQNTASNLTYVVGASMLGATIAGRDESGNLTQGVAFTKDGLADIRITYPANVGTILTGFSSSIDTRVSPLNSARVYVVASSSDNSATTISNQFGFSAIAGFTMEASPSSLSGTADVSLGLEDGGDGISLPFVPINTTVSYTAVGTFAACVDPAITAEGACTGVTNGWYDNGSNSYCINRTISSEEDCGTASLAWFSSVPSTFSVDAYVGASGLQPGNQMPSYMVSGFEALADTDLDGTDDYYVYPYTLSNGGASARIMVRGTEWAVPGDSATVTFGAGDGSASVTVTIPQ